jgi:hypothetical protein
VAEIDEVKFCNRRLQNLKSGLKTRTTGEGIKGRLPAPEQVAKLLEDGGAATGSW